MSWNGKPNLAEIIEYLERVYNDSPKGGQTVGYPHPATQVIQVIRRACRAIAPTSTAAYREMMLRQLYLDRDGNPRVDDETSLEQKHTRCPFCKSWDACLMHEPQYNTCYIQCQYCGGRGPSWETPEKAWAWWRGDPV